MHPRTPTQSNHTARVVGRCIVAMLILLAPRTAHACDAAPWSAIAGLEQQVDVAVMIDRPADQLASAPGRSITRFVTESGLFDDTLDAWATFARSLGVEPHHLTDRLLSKRVTVMLDLERPTTPARSIVPLARWAVLTDADRDTERWVRSRLRASPRDALPGATVLAVEDGRFLMAVVKQPDRPVRLVFAPAASDDLFKLAVAFATDTDPVPAHQDLPDGDIVGFAHLNDLVDRPSTVHWSSTRTDAGWATALALRGNPLNAPTQGIGVRTFDTLARGSLASVTADSTGTLAGLLVANAGIAVNTTTVPREPITLSLFESPEPTTAPLTLRVVSKLPHTDTAAAEFDDLVRSYLVGFVPAGSAAPDSFEGRFPAAVRTHDVVIRPPLLTRWIGSDATIAWRYADAAEGTFAALTCAPAGRADPAALTRIAAEALESTDQPGKPVAFGLTLRPAELSRILAPSGPAASLRWIREFRLVLYEPDDPAAPTTSLGELVLATTPVPAAGAVNTR